jgi:hypothetical protein
MKYVGGYGRAHALGECGYGFGVYAFLVEIKKL